MRDEKFSSFVLADSLLSGSWKLVKVATRCKTSSTNGGKRESTTASESARTELDTNWAELQTLTKLRPLLDSCHDLPRSEIIATIAMVFTKSAYCNSKEVTLKHLEALSYLVWLRGGVDSLAEQPKLREFIFAIQGEYPISHELRGGSISYALGGKVYSDAKVPMF